MIHWGFSCRAKLYSTLGLRTRITTYLTTRETVQDLNSFSFHNNNNNNNNNNDNSNNNNNNNNNNNRSTLISSRWKGENGFVIVRQN